MTHHSEPARESVAREQTDRFHKRPFTGFAPRDEKRRKQTVTLPMDVLLTIVRERLEYLKHGSDLDAVVQNAACEIERAMGVFPNLEGALSASPARGGLEAVLAAYEAETRALPLGAASREKGDSAYNWRMSVVRELRELAASIAPPPEPALAGGVRVKALVWNEYETEGEIDRWDAETALGSFYEISSEFDGYSVSHDQLHKAQRFYTPDEAKAFAQADYESRIRASLDLATGAEG